MRSGLDRHLLLSYNISYYGMAPATGKLASVLATNFLVPPIGVFSSQSHSAATDRRVYGFGGLEHAGME